jgi:hypothetical protein
MRTEEQIVEAFLMDTGYGQAQIEKGLEYARVQGAESIDEIASCAVTRILYTASQIERGEHVEIHVPDEYKN